MPILVKTKSDSGLQEWGIVELQGDLEVRGDENMENQFIGDLNYDKYGQPILIIGHHILHGKEQKMEKPYAVMEKVVHDATESEEIDLNQTSNLDTTANRTVLDSTIAIEHKSQTTTEYRVRAIVRKKLVFKTRPKPIIANVAKTV
ncbi:chromosome transmission fidelity protein 8 homolog [Contarinia nasturtii]|uniref:chromosome transmission fidelity protein 8 homolog n=1 Tax=Contarinia nasturtii TaxID=265458 RepID=UPI0012D3E58C|nr:chromosome transmission fidelity protein 8 homolog [Contarinia nasturtii]